MRPEIQPQPNSVVRPVAGRLQPSPHRGLIWALGLSVAVHAGLVTFRFAAPEAYNRVFQDTPLEVILVNARSRENPQEAQALAQVRLAGGGERVFVAIVAQHHRRQRRCPQRPDLDARRRHFEERSRV